MIIQGLLVGGLLLCLLYAWMQWQAARRLSQAISLVALTGIYLVCFPEHTTVVAHVVGVGRGADLVLYCWLVISLIVSLHLQLQILQLQGLITALTRAIALQGARRSAEAGDTTAPIDT